MTRAAFGPPVLYKEGDYDSMYESVRRATDKYRRERLVRILVIFRREDKDDMRALERIRAQKSQSAYIRRLVLEDIAREEQAGQEGQDN